MAAIFQTTFSHAFSRMKMYTISKKFVPNGPLNNIPALVQIMAWRRSGDKPLSEPMMVSLLTYTYVTRPQWVKETVSVGCNYLSLPVISAIGKIPLCRSHEICTVWAVAIPDSEVHVANMGPIWGRQDPGGPHVGPMDFAIWDIIM